MEREDVRRLIRGAVADATPRRSARRLRKARPAPQIQRIVIRQGGPTQHNPVNLLTLVVAVAALVLSGVSVALQLH